MTHSPTRFLQTVIPDTTPPDTTFISAVDGNNNPIVDGGSTVSTEITFTFAGTDNVTGDLTFECSLDASTFATCTTPKTYTLDDGVQHNFQVRATDTSGNIDPTPASFTWTILTASEGIEKLIETILDMNLATGRS